MSIAVEFVTVVKNVEFAMEKVLCNRTVIK